MSNISIKNDLIAEEMAIIREIISAMVVLNNKKREIENNIKNLRNMEYPNDIISVYNDFVKVRNITDKNFISDLSEEYNWQKNFEIRYAKKKKMKRTLGLFTFLVIYIIIFGISIVMTISYISDSYISDVVYSISSLLSLLCFLGLSGVWLLIVLCWKNNNIDSATIKLWKNYPYQYLYDNIKKLQKYREEESIVNSNLAKVNELINKTKTSISCLPKKYVDYISPFDKVPAIFDMYEILDNKRASSVKELINIYLEDEFKKEQRKHMITMEELVRKQNIISNIIFTQFQYLQNEINKQTDYLEKIENRISELNKNIPTSIDVRIID